MEFSRAVFTACRWQRIVSLVSFVLGVLSRQVLLDCSPKVLAGRPAVPPGGEQRLPGLKLELDPPSKIDTQVCLAGCAD